MSRSKWILLVKKTSSNDPPRYYESNNESKLVENILNLYLQEHQTAVAVDLVTILVHLNGFEDLRVIELMEGEGEGESGRARVEQKVGVLRRVIRYVKEYLKGYSEESRRSTETKEWLCESIGVSRTLNYNR